MLGLKIKRTNPDIKSKSIDKALKYIDNYWESLTRYQTDSNDTLFGLPNPYIVPANQHGNFRFNEQYYWDSYFISKGLIASGHGELAAGMLENLIFMFKRFKMIPCASRLYMTSRSQPPLLTSYIKLISDAGLRDRAWVQQAFETAQEEYLTVWLNETHPHWRQVYKGLSRYYDINMLHDLAETESGWDMTPRFGRKALDFLPIDLNCLLYKYEYDFAEIARQSKDDAGEKLWQHRLDLRKSAINELMWHESKKFYFDFNYNRKVRSSVWSLAAYYSMWAGLASPEKAANLVKNLDHFECMGGLSVTPKAIIDINIFGSLKTQWAYPNGWAPLHLIVTEGLENYGYSSDARRIALKWINTNLNWFEKHKVFLEKYNVAEPLKEPLAGVYPTQTGFAWTNAVFAYLVNKYL